MVVGYFFTEDIVGIFFFLGQFLCPVKIFFVCNTDNLNDVTFFNSNGFAGFSKTFSKVVPIAGWNNYTVAALGSNSLFAGCIKTLAGILQL